jgi:hypothetical protein
VWLLGSKPAGLVAPEEGRGGEFAVGRQWRMGGGQQRTGKGEGRGLNRHRPSGDIELTHEMLAIVRRPRSACVRRVPPVDRRSAARRARPRDNSEGLGVRRMGRRVPRAAVALGGEGADAEADRRTAVARERARRHAWWHSGFKHFVGALFE